jgi:hypothetical protein
MTWEKYEAAHPDEEFWMINGDEILARLAVLENRVSATTNARAQHAYRAINEGGSIDGRLDVLEGRVASNTNARAQYAYGALTDEGWVVTAVNDIKESLANIDQRFAALEAKVNALPQA